MSNGIPGGAVRSASYGGVPAAAGNLFTSAYRALQVLTEVHGETP